MLGLGIKSTTIKCTLPNVPIFACFTLLRNSKKPQTLHPPMNITVERTKEPSPTLCVCALLSP